MPMIPAGPLTDGWAVPEGSGAEFLFKYMRQQQVTAYGSYYTGLSHAIQIRNIKLLCKTYNEDDIKRAIAYGCQISEQPFSTKFVRKILDTCLSDIRSNPMIQFYQNKS